MAANTATLIPIRTMVTGGSISLSGAGAGGAGAAPVAHTGQALSGAGRSRPHCGHLLISADSKNGASAGTESLSVKAMVAQREGQSAQSAVCMRTVKTGQGALLTTS